MEEENTTPQDQKQENDWNKVGASKPESDWAQVGAKDPEAQRQRFILQQAAERDPGKAADILRVSRRFNVSESIAEYGLDKLKAGERANDPILVNLPEENPKLSALLTGTVNTPAAALDHIPSLKALDEYYQRPAALLPLSDSDIQQQARNIAKLRAAKDWAAGEKIDYTSLQGQEGEAPATFTSQQAMEDTYYQGELEKRKNIEGLAVGKGKMGLGEILTAKNPENTATLNALAYTPFAGKMLSVADAVGLSKARQAIAAGTADEIQKDTVAQADRLAQIQTLRGKGFVPGLLEQGMALPAAATEMGVGFGVGRTVTAGLGLSKAAAFFAAPAVGAATAGAPEGVEAFLRNKGAGDTTPEAAAKAARDTYAGYLGAQLFGPWFSKASPELQAVAKESLLKAIPTEAIKMVGMNVASELIRAVGPDAGEHLKQTEIVRAMNGDPQAIESLIQQAIIGGAFGAAHALRPKASNPGLESITSEAQRYADAAEARAKLLHEGVARDNPELARQLSDGLAKDGPNEYTSIPVKAFAEFYKEDARNQYARFFGDPTKYDFATAPGTDLVVSTSAFDHTIGADPKARAFFRNEIRPTPGDVNLREAQVMEKAWADGVRIPGKERVIADIMEKAKGDKLQAALETANLDNAPDKAIYDTLGLSDQQMASIGQALGKAREHAKEILNEKEQARLDRLKSGLYEKEKARATEEVAKEVDSRPEQLALARLAKHQLPDGTPLPEEVPQIKLSRAAIKEAYGKESLRLLPRSIFSSEGGLHPDDAASMLGYRSGQELLAALAKLHTIPTTAKEVQIRKQLTLLEKHRADLESASASMFSESKAATKDVVTGREQIARRLEKAMRDEEHQKNEQAKQVIADIKERGGIRPTNPTEMLPADLRAKSGEGVSSDEIAQELYDKGHALADAESDSLYDYLNRLKEQLKASREKARDFEGDARVLARTHVKASLEAILENARQQEELQNALEQVSSQAAADRPKLHSNRRDAAIAGEVEARMAQKFPNGLQPSELSDEAQKALHNKYAGKLQHLTLEAIEANKLKQMVGVATRKLPSIEEIRNTARAEVLSKPFGQLDPTLYLAAEQRANKEALAAVFSTKWEDVFDRRLEALHAHERYAAAVEAADVAGKTFGNWEKLPEAGYLNKPGTYDFGQQIKNFLRKIGLIGVDPRDLATMKPFAEWAKEKFDAGQTRLEPLDIPKFAEDSFATTPKDMTYGDLLELKDTIDRLTELARDHDKLSTLAGKLSREAYIESVRENVAANFKVKPVEALSTEDMTPMEKAVHFARKVDATLDSPESFFNRMDGGKIDGPMNQLFQGQVEARTYKRELQERFAKAIDKAVAEIPEQVRKHLRDRVMVEGVSRPLTRREIINLVLNGGNESNYSKMVRGEPMRGKDDIGLNHDTIQKAAKLLTEAEKDYAQKILDATNLFKPEVEKMEIWAKGRPPKMIEAKQMIEAMGDRPGGYYPMMYDPRGPGKAGELQISGEVGKLIDPSYKRATTNAGYRESRVEEHAAPVDLNFSRLGSHVDSMLTDIAFRPWLMDANKIVSSPEFRQTMKEHFGSEFQNFAGEWIKRVVGADGHPSASSGSIAQSMLRNSRHAVTVATLAAKPAVFLHHALGFGPAIAEVGPGRFAKAYGEFLSHPRDSYNQMIAESKEMAHYIETSDVDVRSSLKKLAGKDSQWAEMQRFGLKVIPFGNLLRAIPTYFAAKGKAIAELSAKGYEGAQLEKLAIQSAEKTVRTTSGSGNPGDVPAIMKSEGMKMLLMFYTPGRVLYSQMRNAGHDLARGDAGKAIFKALWLLPFSAAVHTLVSGRRPDEDKGETEEGMYLHDALTYPFSALPMGHDIADNAMKALSGETNDFSIHNPLLGALEKTFKAVKKTNEWYNDEAEFEDMARELFKTSGYWLGAPTEQAELTGGYVADLLRDKESPNDIFEFAHDVLWRKPKSRR